MCNMDCCKRFEFVPGQAKNRITTRNSPAGENGLGNLRMAMFSFRSAEHAVVCGMAFLGALFFPGRKRIRGQSVCSGARSLPKLERAVQLSLKMPTTAIDRTLQASSPTIRNRHRELSIGRQLDPYERAYWFDLAAQTVVDGKYHRQREGSRSRFASLSPPLRTSPGRQPTSFSSMARPTAALLEFSVVIANDNSSSVQPCNNAWQSKSLSRCSLRNVRPARNDTCWDFLALTGQQARHSRGAIRTWERSANCIKNSKTGLFD